VLFSFFYSPCHQNRDDHHFHHHYQREMKTTNALTLKSFTP
jgi:hypothetical protein